MKKMRLWMMVLAVCAICAGCSSAETETVATEAAATETVLETMAETQPPETTEETTPVLEEPVGEYYQCLNFDRWYQDDTMPVEIFECRMYPTENGVTAHGVPGFSCLSPLKMGAFRRAPLPQSLAHHRLATQNHPLPC